MGSATTQIIRLLPELLALTSQAAQIAGASGSVAKYLAIASAVLKNSDIAYTELKRLTDLVRQMVAEKREPTSEEWVALVRRSDVAHKAIQDYDIDGEV